MRKRLFEPPSSCRWQKVRIRWISATASYSKTRFADIDCSPRGSLIETSDLLRIVGNSGKCRPSSNYWVFFSDWSTELHPVNKLRGQTSEWADCRYVTSSQTDTFRAWAHVAKVKGPAYLLHYFHPYLRCTLLLGHVLKWMCISSPSRAGPTYEDTRTRISICQRPQLA